MPSSSSTLSFVQKDPSLQHGSAHEHELECNNSSASTFSVGVRVVRGADWPLDDIETDGGEGFVGTVVEIGSNSVGVHENMAVIQWDMGSRGVYRAGCNGHYDLCVLDNSSVGKKTTVFCCRVSYNLKFGVVLNLF